MPNVSTAREIAYLCVCFYGFVVVSNGKKSVHTQRMYYVLPEGEALSRSEYYTLRDQYIAFEIVYSNMKSSNDNEKRAKR